MKHRSLPVRLTAAVLAVCLLFSLAACGKSPASSSTAESGSNTSLPKSVKADDLLKGITAEPVEGKRFDSGFGDSQYAFAAGIFRRSYEADGGNCLVSPLSVMLALAMTANGAAGETLQQMQDVLGSGMPIEDLNAYLYQYVSELPSGDKAKLAIANSIWINRDADFAVKEDFLKKDVSWYNAAVYKLPFNESAVKEINGWVSKNTDKMIKKIVSGLNPEDRLLLINAICFDAKWLQPYETQDVQDAVFTRSNGGTQKVNMMYSWEKEYYEGEDYTGFARYYDGGAYKFVGILPNTDVSLEQFVSSLDGEKLAAIFKSVEYPKVHTGIPEFTYEYETSLLERLEDMGMTRAFAGADFSLMSEDEQLAVSGVVHKTFIEVSKKGTRAAAVTGVTMAATAVFEPEEPKSVILDRPFLYMIVDTAHNLPVFIGTVNSID